MQHIYIDYTGSVSVVNKKFHGGSYYAKNLILSLVNLIEDEKKEEFIIHVFWPNGYAPHDEYEEEIYNSKKIDIITINSLSEIKDLHLNSKIIIPLISIKRWKIFEFIKKYNPTCKLYVTIHGLRIDDLKIDLYDRYYLNSTIEFPLHVIYNVLKKVYLKFMCKRYLVYIDKIFTVSNYTMQSILKICSVKNIKPYYQGIFEPKLIESKLIKEDFILFVSANRSEKNFFRALEGFIEYKKKCPDNLMLYVTGINNKFLEKIKTIYGNDWTFIEKYLKIHEYVSHDLLDTFYNDCKFLLYTSKSEGFGLPILEMGLRGKTVVASSITSIPEVIGPFAYYIDPYNIQSIAEGIQYMNNDAHLREYEQNLKNIKVELKRKIVLNKEMLLYDILN